MPCDKICLQSDTGVIPYREREISKAYVIKNPTITPAAMGHAIYIVYMRENNQTNRCI